MKKEKETGLKKSIAAIKNVILEVIAEIEVNRKSMILLNKRLEKIEKKLWVKR